MSCEFSVFKANEEAIGSSRPSYVPMFRVEDALHSSRCSHACVESIIPVSSIHPRTVMPKLRSVGGLLSRLEHFGMQVRPQRDLTDESKIVFKPSVMINVCEFGRTDSGAMTKTLGKTLDSELLSRPNPALRVTKDHRSIFSFEVLLKSRIYQK